MKSSILKFALAISSLSLLLFACGPSNPEFIQVDPAFREYISGYTSGMVNRGQSIRVELNDTTAQLLKLEQEELNELLEIEPLVPGKVIAISDRVIEFVPAENLPMNQLFTMNLDLESILDVKSGYENFRFQFSTFDQKINVSVDGLRNYGYYNIEYKQLRGTITTTDEEDTVKLFKTLKVELDGVELPIKFDEDYMANSYDFVVDSIKRLDKEQKLVISWDGAEINSFSHGTKELIVSSLHDFSVRSVNLAEDEDQMVKIKFSEPIQPGQDLNGIIQIGKVEGITYKIHRNEVTAFLPNRIIGEKKLVVGTGVKNVAGYKMKEGYTEMLEFHEPYPKVRLKGKGSILPNSQGLIFPFEAIALKAVDVRIIRIYEKNIHYFLQSNDLDGDDELTRFGDIIYEEKLDISGDKSKNLKQWNTHVLDLQKCIKPERGAIYQVSLKFDRSYAICDCPDEKEEETQSNNTAEDLWSERYWHTYGYRGYSTWSYHDNERSPCDDSYYYGRAVKRNILASDIGMIFKLDEDKTAHIFLSDMVSTDPVANASVSLYDYTKNVIATVRTNEQGMAKVKLKKKPFLMIAKKGEQRGYLKLTDGHTNSLSKFNVEGEVVQKGVKGYIYAERGVWRPGDSIYVSFMLQDKLRTLPAGHPISFQLSDPNGNVIYQKKTSKNINGVYDLRTATSSNAPTGNYRAKVEVGNNVYSKYLKVETIKPNRLKIYLEVDKSGSTDSCILTSRWLHGASAKGLDAQVQVQFSPMKTMFKGYEKYHFDSPIRYGRTDKRTIFSGSLDEEGMAKFSGAEVDVKGAPGMLQANYITKVFEKSGEFSIDRQVSSFSPYGTYVGLQTPQVSRYDHSLVTDKVHTFKVVTVDKKGALKSKVPLSVQIYKLDWNWWFDGEDDLTEFTARNSALKVMDSTFETKGGKADIRFNVRYPEYGRYLVLVKDRNGGHQTGEVIYIDWPYWSRSNRSDNEFAKMLSFTTDKEKYTRGESVKISFPSPAEGRALISIESGSKVIKKIWVKTKKGETVCEIPTTAEMAPNVYLHITMLQPHHTTKNDLPIRMYGVMPIFVDDPSTHLEPTITMKDKIRPESTVPITVKEKHGKKMTYTLAIVDDGLLDLTHFRTPNPWNTFYAKEALGVKTWDMYDDVIGAYGGSLNNLLSIGGDGTEVTGDGPKANRFKPMVKFLGPFELPAGGAKRHMVEIPNYVGSVRVMVVAREKEAYGNAQKTVTVKKPLMVLATLPRVIGCGEEFDLPVDVFAMEKHVKNVSVSIETNNMFEALDTKQKAVQFTSEGDEVIDFKLKTKMKMGVGKITIVAKSGNEVARQEIEIDVRPSNPVTYEVENYVVSGGSKITQDVLFDGIKGSNTVTVEISTLPALNLGERLEYLIRYPHGCVEQTTSSVFPQLYLNALLSLSAKEKKVVEHNIKAGIKRLQMFQTSKGGFGYWPGSNYESDWGTNYAGHFLLEAEQLGYRLPSGLKSKWIRYQKEEARQWTTSSSPYRYSKESDQLTQAYRLYLLALANSAELGAMNRLREEKNLGTTARWRLAAAYQLIGQKEVASKLIQGAPTKVSPYRELSYTFGSDLRDQAIILEVMGDLKEKDKGIEVMNYLAEKLRSNRWMSTQETAYSLLAIAKFCKVNSNGTSSKVTVIEKSGSFKTLTIGKKIEKLTYNDRKTNKEKLTITNSGTSNVFVTVVKAKIPKNDQLKEEHKGLNMGVRYTDFSGKIISVDKLSQGTEFIAEVTLTNTTADKWYKELALNQLFPAGWEIFNARFMGEYDSDPVDYKDYRDDRVLSYFALNPGKSITIKVQLSATYKGHYYLPALYAEAMYDHRIHSQLPGRWVRVVK